MARRPELCSADETAALLDQFVALVRDAEMTDPSRRKVLAAITAMRENLDRLERDVDPVTLPDAFFDPSEPRLIGYFVALALISQDRRRLHEIKPFYGAGVYAIYYTGPNPVYRAISNSETPIYVGKADPPIGAATLLEQETKLYGRLNEHRRNIARVAGIDLHDFEYRALAVQSGYQAAAENHLINLFRPVWNNETKILFGIGKHGDSASTRANRRSPWDTMHPGRSWAEDNEAGKSVDEITQEVARHFAATTVFDETRDVFAAFADGIRREDRVDGNKG